LLWHSFSVIQPKANFLPSSCQLFPQKRQKLELIK
jgi:hypothetical protein